MSLPDPSSESVALVTGASSGIGEQFARQLSEMGHRVALVARREDRLELLARELGGPDRAVPIAADLALPEDRDRLAARIEELGAQVEILVNNAGFGIYQAFPEAGREAEIRQVRVLVEAVVDLMARYLPGMRSRGRGAIINMSSTAATPSAPIQRRLRRRQGPRLAAFGGGARRGQGGRRHGRGGLPGPGAQWLSGGQRRRLLRGKAAEVHLRAA